MNWTLDELAETRNRSNPVAAANADRLGFENPCSIIHADRAIVKRTKLAKSTRNFGLRGIFLARISLLGALAIYLGLNTVSAAEDTPPYLQSNQGLVAIEAEHFHAHMAQGKHQWVADKEQGFSGEGAMRVSLEDRLRLLSADEPQSPRLDYEVEFTAAGTHYVWVRALNRGGSSDSIDVGLNGQMLTTGANIQFPVSGDYDWNDGLITTIDVSAPGVHTLNLWMSEPETVVDKLVLSTDAGYVPAGTGPAESPAGEGPPPPVAQGEGSQEPIVIEAEHYHAKVNKSKHRWTPNRTEDYSGEGAMMAAPEDKVSIKSKYHKKSPRMNYQVKFTTPGTYYAWLRALGPEDSSNSVHLGLNGKPIKAGKNITVPVTGDYVWTDGVKTPIKITRPGLHTLNLWMQESGTIIDKIVLSGHSGFTPIGKGPEEKLADGSDDRETDDGSTDDGPTDDGPTDDDTSTNGGSNDGSHSGLADEGGRFAKGELLFDSSMSTPESVKGWKMEGPGIVDFRNGWMHMFSPKEKMHHVYWCPETFPNNFIAEWETQNIEIDAGLSIVFFAAKGEKGEDIFDPTLPRRDGQFKHYTRGKIDSYHISYYANNPGNPNRGHANLRKNIGGVLVQQGEDGIPAKSEKIHKIQLIKDGSHIIMFVDDRKIIDWTDNGKKHGPAHTDGKIGLRQMKWTHFRYRNFKVWSLQSRQQEES